MMQYKLHKMIFHLNNNDLIGDFAFDNLSAKLWFKWSCSNSRYKKQVNYVKSYKQKYIYIYIYNYIY